MTLQLSHQPVLRVFQAGLRAILQPAVNANRSAQNETRLEFLWRDMTSAGDLLINAFRLEQEFSKIDLSKADDDVLEEWRLHRKTVECMAKDYASAVSRWREALEAECRAATWE